ncbi:MAG: glycosyltransferase [Dehalococcoidia bacterium]
MKSGISVILPTSNERENLPLVLKGLQSSLDDPYEILVVGDDSPDKTWRVAEEIAEGAGFLPG